MITALRVAALTLVLLVPLVGWPQEPVNVDLSPGGVRTIRFPSRITKIHVENPRVAGVRVVGTDALEIVGRRVGQSTISVSTRRDSTAVYVSVELPTGELATRLRAIFPTENVVPQMMGNMVVLTGSVSDPVVAKRIEEVVRATVNRKTQTVLNYLQIEGRQQVQLSVKIAEVSRTAMREMGMNMWLRNNNYAGGSLAPGSPLNPNLANGPPALNPLNAGALPAISGPMAENFGLHFASNGTTPISVAINIMQSRGLAKILSEPTLVAYSGHEANFLAGGEFPIPVPQGLGQTTITFKKFGVQLQFTPTVLRGQTIHLKVSVTVSDKDAASSVISNGVSVPGLSTRYGETTVRMRSGESFAIAGLLQDAINSVSTKVPLLGDIPVLGALFRQKSFERVERELVILVTPALVRPLRPGEVPALPGEDEMADPGAAAFFLLGSVDPEIGRDKKGNASGRSTKMVSMTGQSRPAGPIGFSE